MLVEGGVFVEWASAGRRYIVGRVSRGIQIEVFVFLFALALIHQCL